MELVVHELDVSLEQQMTSTKNQIVMSARPHLYIHNSPTGTLKLSIYEDDGMTLIVDSEELSIATIESTIPKTEDFYHGYVKFDFPNEFRLLKDQVFYVRLVSGGGYAFAESDYIGWCNDYDLRKYDADYTPNTGVFAALDIEFWEKQISRKGRY